MSIDLEPYYQEIGRLALEVAAEGAETILVFAQMDEGELEADLFYREGSERVQYRLCPPALAEVIWAFWDISQETAREWDTLRYVLQDGAFRVELGYPPGEDEDEGALEDDSRPAAIEAVFGDSDVDYSSPGV